MTGTYTSAIQISPFIHAAARIVFLATLLSLWPAGSAFARYNTCVYPNDEEKQFLERLMALESSKRRFARNPRSSALGPFQFLRGTFLHVIRRHMPELAEGKSHTAILRLRTDPEISRDVALLYTRENAAFLNARGIAPSAAFLRLAFFIGPANARKVITADAKEPLVRIISAAAVGANPFLKRMTAEDLIRRATLETGDLESLHIPDLASEAAASERGDDRSSTAGRLAESKPSPPAEGEGRPARMAIEAVQKIEVKCDLRRVSCKRWLTLAKARQAKKLLVTN